MSGSGTDLTTAKLARFAGLLRYDDLPADVVHEAKRRVVDALGCALGGFDSPPGRIARELAGERFGARGASVLGLTQRTTPEMAAFANGVMIRYLDFNDSFASTNVSSGHPSDMISGILAVADAFHATGRAAILGVVAAYEAASAVPIPLKRLGWDQGISISIGVSTGVGVVLGLTEEQIGNAISLAITPNIPLRVTRSGELSMWKGCATSAASHSAVLAALLAAKGMTGPSRPFEGRHGVWEQVSQSVEVEIDPKRNGFRIATSDIKLFPVAGGIQKVLYTLLEMTRGIPPEEISSIEVRTYAGLWLESGSEREKWDPKTRETADHSLPYVIAIGLRHGTISAESFSDEVVQDPSLRPMMNKIRVVENPEFTAANPDTHGVSEVEITTLSGTRLVARTGVVRGNHLNPMTDAEIEVKFRGLAEPVSSPERCRHVLSELWALDGSQDTSEVLDSWASMVA